VGGRERKRVRDALARVREATREHDAADVGEDELALDEPSPLELTRAEREENGSVVGVARGEDAERW
jgi:hypothetical protein